MHCMYVCYVCTVCYVIHYTIHHTLHHATLYTTLAYKTRSKATLYLCPFEYVLSNSITLYFIMLYYIDYTESFHINNTSYTYTTYHTQHTIPYTRAYKNNARSVSIRLKCMFSFQYHSLQKKGTIENMCLLSYCMYVCMYCMLMCVYTCLNTFLLSFHSNIHNISHTAHYTYNTINTISTHTQYQIQDKANYGQVMPN